METPLTLSEMVNFEIPMNYQLPISSFKKYTNSWNLPKFAVPYSIFERKRNSIEKYLYVDVSREKQREFLTRSGKIKKHQLKYASLRRVQKSIPTTPKTLSFSNKTENKKQKKSADFFDTVVKPKTASFLQKNRNNSHKSYFSIKYHKNWIIILIVWG